MTTRIHAVAFAVVSLAIGACGSADKQAAAPTTTTSSPSTLEGKSYDVTLLMGSDTVKDSLVFNGGKFESTACTEHGFPKSSEYTSKPGVDTTDFHALTKHPDGKTTIDWNGKVKGNTIEGTATRTMDGKTENGTFKGELKK